MKKKLTVVAALVLVLAMGVGGTLAYLTSTPAAITNTFTVGNVKIELNETKGGNDHQFKMIPGEKIAKDPTVTVKGGSEACWLFVKVDASENFTTFFDAVTLRDPSTAVKWTKLDGQNNVYYIKQDATTADVDYYLLQAGDGDYANGYLTVKSTVTQDDMDDIGTEEGKTAAPTLTFTAYAIQYAGFETAAAAWTEVSKSNT